MPYRSIVFSMLLLAVGAPATAAQSVSAFGFARTEVVGLGGATPVPGCNQSVSGTPIATAVRTCIVSNGTFINYFAEATTSGVLRASANLTVARGITVALASNEVLGITAGASFTDRLAIRSLAGARLPTRLSLWLSIDGTMIGTGTVDGQSRPSLYGQFNMVIDPGQSTGAVWGGTFGQVDPYVGRDVRFVGDAAVLPDPNVVSVAGNVGFLNRVVVENPLDASSGYVDFTLLLLAYAALNNFGVTPVNSQTSSGLFINADFANTARIAGVQAFDANGVDVSGAFTYTLSNGTSIASGIPTAVPEPKSFALSVTGAAMLGFMVRRRRRRSSNDVVLIA